MGELFKIMSLQSQGPGNKAEICIGMDVKMAGQSTLCAVSKVCRSQAELNTEVEKIQNQLKEIIETGKELFGEAFSDEGFKFTPDMSPEKIWSILSAMEEDSLLVKSFNNLDDDKRREVAEYVLTSCNIFSGKASYFSGRYNSESGLIE